jgi:hypothetical protein
LIFAFSLSDLGCIQFLGSVGWIMILGLRAFHSSASGIRPSPTLGRFQQAEEILAADSNFKFSRYDDQE